MLKEKLELERFLYIGFHVIVLVRHMFSSLQLEYRAEI